MDKSVERALARKITRQVSNNLKPYGYNLTKPSFLCREQPLLVSFFHFHKFSFGPRFRVHFGVRVLNDDFDAVSLNGLWFEHAGAYKAGEADIGRCIQAMTDLLVSKGVLWHNTWSDVQGLLSKKNSPLLDSERQWLAEAIGGQPLASNLALSRQLLGIKAKLSAV